MRGSIIVKVRFLEAKFKTPSIHKFLGPIMINLLLGMNWFDSAVFILQSHQSSRHERAV